ncbi:MAG: QueT transporter family protein, partial [Acutalibacteraceae bacterium]
LTRNIRIKGLPVLSAVFPVIFNALIIGAEITFLASEGFQWRAFVLTAASVGFGELVVCFVLGLPLSAAIERIKIFKK